jgi:voltage-gated potassium channel
MERLERWETIAEWPLTVTALVFLVAYAAPIAAGGGAPSWLVPSCELVVWIAWAAFAADYVIRFWLAPLKWTFVKSNLLDLAVVALPLLRPLRLIRLLALLSILNRTGTRNLRGRVVVYTAGATVLLVTIGALAITDAERGEPGANITNLGDGFWWAITTMTTVGYGDRYPVTATGRFVAAALMVGGIALLGVITATIASWLVQRVSEVTETEEAATRAQVDVLAAEIASLRDEIRAAQRPEQPVRPDGVPD